MLTEKEIQQALHASRVVPLSGPNPHGPLGLEQLTAAVVHLPDSPIPLPENGRISRTISLSVQTWEKLHQLAQSALPAGTRSLTPPSSLPLSLNNLWRRLLLVDPSKKLGEKYKEKGAVLGFTRF